MQQLLHRIQFNDDQQAFKEFYQHLFFRLFQFAYSFLKQKESAEEVVDDVFLGLWQKRSTLHTIKNMNVYLYVAVRNASLNKLRSHKQMFTSIDEFPIEPVHLTFNPENELVTRELQQKVQEAIDRLPTRCKLIFKLVKEDGLSYKEAASILEVSTKTIDAQLYIALKKLSSSLRLVWAEYGITSSPS